MSLHRKVLVITLLAMLITCVYFEVQLSEGQTYSEESVLKAADNVVGQVFNGVLAAEKQGANVTVLLDKLSIATSLLAEAQNTYRSGNFSSVEEKADAAVLIALQVASEAQNSKEEAQNSANTAFWSNISLTVIGVIVLVLVLFVVWLFIKGRYVKDVTKSVPRVITDEA